MAVSLTEGIGASNPLCCLGDLHTRGRGWGSPTQKEAAAHITATVSPHTQAEFYLEVEDKITEVNRDSFYFIKKLVSTWFMDEIHRRSLLAGSVGKNRGAFSVFRQKLLICIVTQVTHMTLTMFLKPLCKGSNPVVTSGGASVTHQKTSNQRQSIR